MELIVSFHHEENGRVTPLGSALIDECEFDAYKRNAGRHVESFAARFPDDGPKPNGLVIVDDLERQIFHFRLGAPGP